jgi:two-component system chemotaxis response regulator CheB
VSSHAHSSDVFKAMELGAYDFVSKPDGAASQFGEELLEKVRAVGLMREPMRRHTAPAPAPASMPFVVAIGASTGGPGAIQRILEAMAVDPRACLVIVQHMPPGFTTAFAERLDRLGTFAVREAADGDVLGPGKAFIAPGGKQLLLRRSGDQLELATVDGEPGERHVPSVDRLFGSVAEVLGERAVGVVLTGMGNDGAKGAQAIARAGGLVLAEAKETAVIFGMPGEAIATGAVKRILPLHELPGALLALGVRPR